MLYKNKISNFYFYNIALGSNDNKKIIIDNNNFDHSHVIHSKELVKQEKKYSSKNKNILSIKSISFDNFIKDNKINQVDFLKIDIDGSEFIFIINALATFKLFKPFIIFEWFYNRFLEYKKDFYFFLDQINPFYNIFIVKNENLDLKNLTKINSFTDLPKYNCTLFFESKNRID